MDTPNAIDQLFSYFAVVHSPRRQPPMTRHPLEAIITITILATICGAHNWGEIAQWVHAHHPWLAALLDLPHDIPSHDACGRVFALHDPMRLQQALTVWMSALADLAEDGITLEGTAIRRSLARADGKGAIHVVSAWASTRALVLAQCKVDDTSHESTALPELLALLHLQGSVVTIDAMD